MTKETGERFDGSSLSRVGKGNGSPKRMSHNFQNTPVTEIQNKVAEIILENNTRFRD